MDWVKLEPLESGITLLLKLLPFLDWGRSRFLSWKLSTCQQVSNFQLRHLLRPQSRIVGVYVDIETSLTHSTSKRIIHVIV